MNELQARALMEVYQSMGYHATFENTGGNVWLVYVNADVENAPVVVFGYDTVTRYGNEEALDAGEATYIVNLA